jgi:hypothetical protein
VAKALLLGGRYFAIVFAVAFALGVLRTLVVAPATGAFVAVLIEVPIIIGASWFIAKLLLRHQRFGIGESLVMGGFAFGLLMFAEAGLAGILSGQSVREWAMAVVTPTGLFGLAGQVVFGLMPLLARHSSA